MSSPDGARRALFLDRDGVVVRDVDRVTRPDQLVVLAGAAAAIARARRRGYLAVLVTNQPVIARGLLSEDELTVIHAALATQLAADGAALDGVYYCPHHPRAELERYREACDCRKPRPGMLLRAARELALDLGASVMIGDRPSDIVAGRRAGCRTVLVRSGMHLAPPIESPDAPEPAAPDATHDDLAAAVDWLLAERAP